MFWGTTPSILSQFVHGEIARINPKRLFVPFAGNFVIAQLAGSVDKNIEVFSTDISLYSAAIGLAATNQPINITLSDAYREKFPTFGKSNDPLEQAAEVVFFADYAASVHKAKHKYYASILKNGELNAERYKSEIIAKLKKFISNLGNLTFYAADACELIAMVQPGDMVYYDPPFDLGSYDKQFGILENEIYNYTKPPFTEITDELKHKQLADMNSLGVYSYYRTHAPLEKSIEGYSECFLFQRNYTAFYRLHTNTVGKTFVSRSVLLRENSSLALPIISTADHITPKSKIEVVKVKSETINHYRLLWTKKAQMVDDGVPYLILIDGKVIGATALVSGLKFSTIWCSIFSDVTAPTSQYKRLSKLILYLICTQEMLGIINDATMWEHTGFTTRVFTNEMVSMKYRNLFDLVERSEDVGGFYKYKLLYHSKKLLPTFRDGLLEWPSKRTAKF